MTHDPTPQPDDGTRVSYYESGDRIVGEMVPLPEKFPEPPGPDEEPTT